MRCVVVLLGVQSPERRAVLHAVTAPYCPATWFFKFRVYGPLLRVSPFVEEMEVCR